MGVFCSLEAWTSHLKLESSRSTKKETKTLTKSKNFGIDINSWPAGEEGGYVVVFGQRALPIGVQQGRRLRRRLGKNDISFHDEVIFAT